MTRPDPDRTPSDDDLLRVLGVVLEEAEPVPPEAVGFATGAFAWRDMEIELAELLHDSALEEAVVLRDDVCLRILVLQSGDVTLDIEHGSDRLAGAVSPAGRYRVEIREAGPASLPSATSVLTDENGMFEVDEEIRGTVRFFVSDATGDAAIVSPWITL